ncbi:MAG TPA: serine hydrolase domain-containing protein [Ideonella sp.]|uniref:serine hydrolase domain-containing protein n=1 Tax=Ideonella sp. TaxID=1929293 RepID=UPI002E340FD3|nr:serine hydrolase domain-containing protein [Ideonella sp.]HEX5685360.1 serine hydrolase domain-containing protein [Ideonella sp.]
MRALQSVVLSLTLPWLGAAVAAPVAPVAAAAPAALVKDTPSATVAGNTFLAPVGWRLSVRGPATLLEAPEGGSWLALIDIDAPDANAALAAAWAAYKPDAKWPLKVATPIAPKDGWSDRQGFSYQTSPNERRDVSAEVRRANKLWTVIIYDMAGDVGEKRGAQVGQVFGKLLPKGYQRESFAGKKANRLDAARLADLGGFIERAMAATGVPGVALGLVQDGKVVYSGGFGVKEMGKQGRPDGDTRFMIASNTKAMATLMLATLVDEQKIGWESTAVSLLPSFKLGSDQTTRQVKVKHLICACTGMPRQDLEWLLEFKDMTPASAMTLLGTMQPTSGFGELFQYSNPMAAAAGYLGGHVAYPQMELGAAYDKAMQERVFGPLKMTNTTHDFKLAKQGNVAAAHAPDVDGRMTHAEDRTNLSVIPVRPAGGAWSTVNDVLRYVQMELDGGRLPDGKQLLSRDVLMARRAPQVTVSTDVTYGMGLQVNTVYGTPVVHHGGDMIGFHSDMMWLPEHNVGAVVLTNADPGWMVRSVFRRKLLEVLFDGRPEADAQISASAKSFYDELAADRKLLTVPAAAAVATGLAKTYGHPVLGEIRVSQLDNALRFDFGEYASDMGSRRNPDGTDSLLTVVPGFSGLEFVVGRKDDKRTLTLRDAQHEYVLVER